MLRIRRNLRYSLNYRNLEKMVTERGVNFDHSTIARWVLHFSPILNTLIRREMRRPNHSWRVDETYARVEKMERETGSKWPLLIRQGCRLIGVYNSGIDYGKDSIQVIWNRLIFNDAISIDLSGMIGQDVTDLRVSETRLTGTISV